MINENFKGHLAAISANLIFGLNMSISKSFLGASWMSPIGFSIIRMFIGLAFFWIISFFMPREKTAGRDILIIITGGLLGLAGTQVTFAFGIRFVSPVIWSLIAALGPIFVLLFSALFLGETISVKKAIGVITGISGAILVVLRNRSGGAYSSSVFGICCALFGVTGYAAYIVITRKVSAKYTPVTLTKWMFLASFILLFPLGIQELPDQSIFSQELTLLPILQLGFSILFSSILAYCLIPVALKRIKATTLIMYSNLLPLAASSSAIIIGQDVFTWDKPLALLLVIAGIYIVTQSQSPENKEKT